MTSERVSLLSWPAEVFYRRLHSVVDDFGRYYATPMLLRAACYPLQLDKVSDQDVGKWLGETRKAGLVRVFESGGKQYLVVLCFRQQVRAKASKFPQPPPDEEYPPSECVADAQQLIADAHLDGDGDGDGGGKRAHVRASRLPTDWKLSTEQIEWAIGAQPTWDAEHALKVGEAFRDYWKSVPGNRGLKLDWDATWRTWVRKEGPTKRRPPDDRFAGAI